MIIIDDSFAISGFTAGNEGIWTRNEPTDLPTMDYSSLSKELCVPFERIIRPYQANASRVAIVGYEHGGSGVIKGNNLTQTDGLVTSEKGLVLSIIAADCVPVYLADRQAEIIGLLHCSRQSLAGDLIHNGIRCMKELGAVPQRITATLGPHICSDCYEVSEEIKNEFADSFSESEFERIFITRGEKLYLDMSKSIAVKLLREIKSSSNINVIENCTCHGSGYYSYRRGDRGHQNLAYIMMKV